MVRIIKKSLIRTWLKKLKRHNSIAISILGYENMEKYPIYVSKQSYEEKHVDLLLIGEEGKSHHVLIKDFNAFMFDHTWHCGKNVFMDDWEKFNETSLLEKEFFYSYLREISKYLSWNIWTPCCSFSWCTWICMTTSLKKYQSKINWYWYVMNGRKWYQGWHISYYLAKSKSS